jgi:hypothetical protein
VQIIHYRQVRICHKIEQLNTISQIQPVNRCEHRLIHPSTATDEHQKQVFPARRRVDARKGFQQPHQVLPRFDGAHKQNEATWQVQPTPYWFAYVRRQRAEARIDPWIDHHHTVEGNVQQSMQIAPGRLRIGKNDTGSLQGARHGIAQIRGDSRNGAFGMHHVR